MIIAITGGIGCGKSIVSKILRSNGYHVYDTDSEAKRIMDIDTSIHTRLNTGIHPEAVKNGKIDRRLIADIVFNDSSKLEKLNSIVHKAVIDDMLKQSKLHDIMFVETAILYQSHMDKIVDRVWEVKAPVETRISRVVNRNNCSPQEVEARIRAQESFHPTTPHPITSVLTNDGTTALLPQVIELLEDISGH